MLLKNKIQTYSLDDVFGIGEKPYPTCPTYFVRSVHKEFQYSVEHEKQHIIVYGASKQGKSWLVEWGCKSFVRIGCDLNNTRANLFKAMLDSIGYKVGQTTSTNSSYSETQLSGKMIVQGNAIVAKGEGEFESGVVSNTGDNTSFTYINIDLENQNEVISALREKIDGRFIVLENFHYLSQDVQKELASSLRDFLYYGIRVIIIGIWKETSKLENLVPDLSSRIEYIDIGNWSENELREVARLGANALNIDISENILNLIIKNSGYNIGIFKSNLKKVCKDNEIYTTQSEKIVINDIDLATRSLENSYQQIINPVMDRIDSLATSKKAGTKGMRYYIVSAILSLIDEKTPEELLCGIDFQEIVSKVNISQGQFNASNIKQELINIHTRSESIRSRKDKSNNVIPLFYFDRAKRNGVLYIVESVLIVARMKGEKFENILGAVEKYVN